MSRANDRQHPEYTGPERRKTARERLVEAGDKLLACHGDRLEMCCENTTIHTSHEWIGTWGEYWCDTAAQQRRGIHYRERPLILN